MPDRLSVLKTYKLFIDGKFPRSESGRSMPIHAADGSVLAHASLASRKDLRDAVEAARKAQPGWAAATAYHRGQILYRMAEMLEGKRNEFQEAISSVSPVGSPKTPAAPARSARSATRPARVPPKQAESQVAASIDRLVAFAGWADKYAQLAGRMNPVAGPFYNFTVPEPTGVVGVIAPDIHPLLALVTLIAPALCSGNAVVALASSTNPLPAAMLGEVCATGDVPPGVINLLTGDRAELLAQFALHRDIDAIHAAVAAASEATTLREGAAENLKRVVLREPDLDWYDTRACGGPDWIEPLVEMKTVWHPSAV